MKRMKTILGGTLAVIALIFVSKKTRTVSKPQPNVYQADDNYLPDSLAIHHWLS